MGIPWGKGQFNKPVSKKNIFITAGEKIFF